MSKRVQRDRVPRSGASGGRRQRAPNKRGPAPQSYEAGQALYSPRSQGSGMGATTPADPNPRVQRGPPAPAGDAASPAVKKEWLRYGGRGDDSGASGHLSLLGMSDETGSGGVANVSGSVGKTPNAKGGTTSGASVTGSLVDGQFSDGSGVTMAGGTFMAGTETDAEGNRRTGAAFDGAFMEGHDRTGSAEVANLHLFGGVETNADGSSFAGVKGSGGFLSSELDNGAQVDMGQVRASVGSSTEADGSSFDGSSVSAAGLEVRSESGDGFRMFGADARSGVETDADGKERFVAEGNASAYEFNTGELFGDFSASGKVMDLSVDAFADENQERMRLDFTPLAIEGEWAAGNNENQSGGASFSPGSSHLELHHTHGDTNDDGLAEYGAGVDVDLLGVDFEVGAEARKADQDGDGVEEVVGRTIDFGFGGTSFGELGDTDDDGMMEKGKNLSILGAEFGYETKRGDTDGDGVEETGYGVDFGAFSFDAGDSNRDGETDYSAKLGPVGVDIADTDQDGEVDYNLKAGIGGFKVDYSTEDPLGDLVETLNPFDAPGHDDENNMTHAAIDTAVRAKDAIVDRAADVKENVADLAEAAKDKLGNTARGARELAGRLFRRGGKKR